MPWAGPGYALGRQGGECGLTLLNLTRRHILSNPGAWQLSIQCGATALYSQLPSPWIAEDIASDELPEARTALITLPTQGAAKHRLTPSQQVDLEGSRKRWVPSATQQP